jgi:type IV pilus assembly protein PilB
MAGHLALTTLHTTSTVGVVERLRDLGLDRHPLASSLRGVVAQRLARRVCGECSAEGCLKCGTSGYRGRIPLIEVLTSTPAIGEMIGRGALSHELQRVALASGMRSIREVAAECVAEGLTTTEGILRVLGDDVADNGPSSGVPTGEPGAAYAALPAPEHTV